MVGCRIMHIESDTVTAHNDSVWYLSTDTCIRVKRPGDNDGGIQLGAGFGKIVLRCGILQRFSLPFDGLILTYLLNRSMCAQKFTKNILFQPSQLQKYFYLGHQSSPELRTRGLPKSYNASSIEGGKGQKQSESRNVNAIYGIPDELMKVRRFAKSLRPGSSSTGILE